MEIERLNSVWLKMKPYVLFILKDRGEYDPDLVSDVYLELYERRDYIRDNASDKNVAWYAISIAENMLNQKTDMHTQQHEYNDTLLHPDRSLTGEDQKYINSMIDVVLNAFERITKRGRVDYAYKGIRRKVLDMYLQGYTFREIARATGRYDHKKTISILWNTIRDIQKILNLPVSPASNRSGILMRHGRQFKNSYLE